jgi:hypothetical protein
VTETDEEGNIIGFNVLDSYDSCPLVADGWTYAEFVLDEDSNPLYYTGPDGELWYFYSEEDLFAQPEVVEEPFYFGIYGASPFEYNFDVSEIYAFLETYDEGLNMFYYYDSSGAACEFNSDFDEEGNLQGWVISDPWEDFHCPWIANGWTYSYVTLDEQDGLPTSYTGPDDEQW